MWPAITTATSRASIENERRSTRVRVFVDTSAFYAVLDRDDARHARAKRAWHKLLEGGEHAAITTNYVVVETVAIAQNRLGVQAVRTFVDDVLAPVSVEFVSSGARLAPYAAARVPR